jgi:TonB family protein
MDVSDVLRDRMHEADGLQRAVGVSFALHAAFVATLLLAPGGWLRPARSVPVPVMTISLGGGAGPNSGGMTAAGGQPVQVQRPPEEIKREPPRPPAAKAPEMTVPLPNARPRKSTSAPPVTQAPDEARGRTPTRGERTAAGSATAETGVRGQGFGLSTGGGPGAGSTLDVADFCCPEYIATMLQRIYTVWQQNQGAIGECVVKFTIQRDGTIVNTDVEKTSGNPALDAASKRSIVMTRQLPPLPSAFPNPTLTVHLNFRYQ